MSMVAEAQPFSPAPLEVEQVLDADWLSAALSQDRAPVRVRGFEVVETLGPSALKIRIALDLEPGSDVPDRICIKGVFDPALATWLTSGAQKAEAWFYRDVASTLSVRVPRCYYAGVDDATGAGHIIMEDLVPQGVRFLSALSPYTMEQAGQSLDQLARLHGGTWNADPAAAPWVNDKLSYFHANPPVAAERLTELMRQERGDRLPEAIRDGDRIYAAIAALARRNRTGDTCFVHGDCHAGNVWEGPDGIGLVDWQVLQRGNWSQDVAYHIAAALDVEDRRAHERDLLARYLERLAAHGGVAPTFDDAWRLYRAASPYGLLMWGMTQRVEPAIVNQFVTRLGTAAADHGAFELLGV
jgi:aminoglycoside phosphotransferase (APT) family kinase protein